jgi:hypothetical protein
MTIMDSWKDNLRLSKSFKICVYLVDGTKEISSNIPIDLLEEALTDIAMVESEGIGLTIWNKDMGNTVTIGKGQVMKVVIVYNRV